MPPRSTASTSSAKAAPAKKAAADKSPAAAKKAAALEASKGKTAQDALNTATAQAAPVAASAT